MSTVAALAYKGSAGSVAMYTFDVLIQIKAVRVLFGSHTCSVL